MDTTWISSIKNKTYEDRLDGYLESTTLETRRHRGDLFKVFKYLKVLITYIYMFFDLDRTNTRSLYFLIA